MPFVHQPRINTKILDPKGKTLPVKITSDYCSFKITYKKKEIGYTEFTIKSNTLYINYMYNNTISDTEGQLKHVGLALFECVFNKSLACGKGGNIELNSIGKSSIAYYKWGLRLLSSPYNILLNKINDYKEKPTEANKIRIIKDQFSYKELQEEAAYYLKKDLSTISFDEAINYGRYSRYNDPFGEVLKNNQDVKVTDCIRYGMQSYMYLPEIAIENNIKKFGINNFCPIGSNLSASILLSYGHSCKDIADARLQELVNNAQIDPANAMEILHKYSALTKPQLELMLSPVGLELMCRNYVSAWYMMVYLQNDLTNVVSEKFLYLIENGDISCIEEYVNNPSKFADKLDILPLLWKGGSAINHAEYHESPKVYMAGDLSLENIDS